MSKEPDVLRMWFSFGLQVLGIISMLILFLVTVVTFRDKFASETIVAILGGVTTVVGTLAGSFGGQVAGAAGKERAEERANLAQERLTTAQERFTSVAAVNPDVIRQAQARFPDLFADPRTGEENE